MNNNFNWEDTMFLNQQKRWNKIIKIVTAVFIFIRLVYYVHFQPNVVGGDERYLIYIFWIPFSIFFILAIVLRRKYLSLKLRLIESYAKKASFLFILFIQIVGFVLLTVVNTSDIAWNTYNKVVARKNVIMAFFIPVHSFDEYYRNSFDKDEVHFFFNGKFSKLPMSSEAIEFYIEENPADYHIQINARKGLWDNYLVESWEVFEK